MAKLTLKMEYENKKGYHKDVDMVFHVPDDASLDDLLHPYRTFLIGLTFVIDGELTIQEEGE